MVMDPRLTSELTPELKNIVLEIESQSRNLGLDFTGIPIIEITAGRNWRESFFLR